MIILSHPTGNANVRAVAAGLHQAGILSGFRTSIASFQGSLLDSLAGLGPFSEIRRRRFDVALQAFTKTWPWLEMGRLVSQKGGFQRLTQHEKGMFCIDAVYQGFDKKIAAGLKASLEKGANAVYAYEDGACFSFQKAKELNISCFYDLPIGYWRAARRLLEKEREQKPEWAVTLTGFRDSEAKLARKDEELRLADRIFVASSFTANTLKDFPGVLPPVEVIPYGFPSVVEKRQYPSFSGSKPLRFLYVGGLSQRKGIADLFEAVDSFKQRVSLTVVGKKGSFDCPALNKALAKHRWIPSLPHAEVLKLMQEHDVLVFPSLFEGFGLVITEAMSQGTPVITTDRTAGPDLISHGENGWLFEGGKPNALHEAIDAFLSRPEMIVDMGRAARETASKRPWEVYGRELAEAICKHSKI